MPIYDYACTKCEKTVEVLHNISEIENPSEETKKEITCYCTGDGEVMIKLISAPGIKTPTRNRYLNEDRKKRNHNHFKNEVLPSVDVETRNHHLKKMGKPV